MKKLLSILMLSAILIISGNVVLAESNFIVNESRCDLQTITPPPTPVRQIAEFEPMEGVIIRYPFGISYEIIAEMAEDDEVVTIVANPSEQSYVESQYQSHGINLDHCSFLIAPSDSYWTRDYGPWFVFTGNDELAVIDFEYNRPRPNDNAIPSAYANNQSLPLYEMPLTHAGGNYMTDGQRISVSTTLVWAENPGYTHQEINQIVYDYLEINMYHVVPDVLDEYIEHIDCWAKYLDPDTIMIIEVPQEHSQYDEIEAAVDYFENQMSCYGTPYEIARIYTPYGEPYINSLILNNKVLIPITGSQWDDEAIESYENAMPGHEVLGFTGSWVTTDALHCRVKGIPDRYMLYIEHTPLSGIQTGDEGFEIQTKIVPYSGESLVSESTCVYWKVEGNWNSIQLEPDGSDHYHAIIPPQEDGVTVSYYIHAEDYSGRGENHPYIGAADPHTFIANTSDAPKLEISKIRGGIGRVFIDIKNVGGATVHAIDWTISVNGGLLGNINIESECDTCTEPLEVDEIFVERTDKFIFGFGSIEINATAKADDADEVTTKATGFVLGPFVIVIKS